MVFSAPYSNNYFGSQCFICGVNRSTRRKPPTCRKSLTIFITLRCIENTSPRSRFELTTSVVIFPDCTGSYKSSYQKNDDSCYGDSVIVKCTTPYV